MATSTGVTTRSKAKVLTTTITQVFSDDEEPGGVKNPSIEEMSISEKKENIGTNEKTVVVADLTVSQPAVSHTVVNQIESSTPAEVTELLSSLVENIEASGNGCDNHHVAIEDSANNERSSGDQNDGVSMIACSSRSAEVIINSPTEITSDVQCSHEELRATLDKAISDARKQRGPTRQFDDDYEDDGFVLKARRKSGLEPSNGHVPAVDASAEINDDDMRRINDLFGDYEYEDKDGLQEESEEESILSDPSDLHEESGNEEEDLMEDDVENYGKNDKRVKKNQFVDDEAVEDNTVDDDIDDALIDPRFSSDESSVDEDEDRAIRSPLKKKDFLDEEAVEDNNLKSLYGWTDCSPNPSEEIRNDWKWNHGESDEDSSDEEDEFTEDEDSHGDDSNDEYSIDEGCHDEGADDESIVNEMHKDPTNPLWIIFDSVRSYKDASGKSNVNMFMRLPNLSHFPDYYDVIEKPISLVEIQTNIESGDYNDTSSLVEDLNLMFENAKKYNRADSKIYKDACIMQKVMQKKADELTRVCLDTSDDEVETEKWQRKRKSKRRVIEDDDEDGEVKVVETKTESPTKPNKAIAIDPDDCVVVSTSSVFTVRPLDPNYQPGRNNRQIFQVRNIDSHLNDNKPKKKKNEDKIGHSPNKKAKTCNVSDHFILDHDLVMKIDRSKIVEKDDKIINKLDGLLKKGLQQRVTAISIKEQEVNGKCIIFVGMNLDIDRAYETVVKGPSADNVSEVKSFKKFWGDKVETRRYPDLSILASVHFPAATLSEQRNIVPQIFKYIVSINFKISQDDIVCHDEKVNEVLKCKRFKILGTGEEELLSLSESFEALRNKIRNLKDLPLGISSIKGISPSFRGAEVFTSKTDDTTGHFMDSKTKIPTEKFGCLPLPEGSKFIPTLIKPQEVIMELETSGKWPDDLTALRQVKTQILYNLMAQIYLNYKLPVKLSESYLDILYDRFVFRIHVAVKKEIILLRQFKTDTGLMLAKRGQVPEADELELRNECLPTLTSALNGISTQFISYNTVVRLAKRWLSSQYLYTLISDLVIELVVAYVYLSDLGYTGPPNSPLTGFMRFLELVSKFKWNQEPLFVNMNQKFTELDVSQIKNSFKPTQDKSPFMICTPYDLSPGCFTKVNGIINSSHIFYSFVRNALSSFNCLKEMVKGTELFNIIKIFRHPLEDYHAIINLKHEFVATSVMSLETNIVLPPNKSKKVSEGLMPVIDFDVVKLYLESLRKRYGKEAIFFYDHFGGTKILVHFTPETLKQFSVPSQSSNQICEYEKMIDDFRLMGYGIVEDIKVNPDKWS